jgi:hypothetical protein
MMLDFDDVDVSDLFKISLEERKMILEQGINLFIEQARIGALVLNVSVDTFLDKALDRVDLALEKAKENENYELVWYLNELIWGVHSRRQQKF